MKPTFALDLTRETIALLHRTPKGWLSIGEAAFDAPDLAEAMDYLRKTALGLSPLGIATKLILPNSQILYTEIHAPGPSRDEKRRQIATALEGRTPYAVEDLVFDWSGKGATVKVAVIARETLDQAEGFAVEHRLNPVSFVAIPDEGTFVGEPWFGPTAAAASLLAEDETVERDRDPVSVIHRELPKAEPLATEPEVAAEPDPEPEVAPEPVAEPVAEVQPPAPAEDEPLPGLEEALNAELPLEEPATAAPEAAPPAALVEDDADLDLPPPPAPAAAPAPVAAEAEPDEAPFAHVTDTAAFPEDEAPPKPPARKLVVEDLDDDIPPAPPSAAMVAFASRRALAADAVSRPVDGVTRPAAAAAMPAATKLAPAARTGAAKGFPGLVTAPTIPGTRAKPKLKGGEIPRPTAAAASVGAGAVKSPARPGGTFGATAPAKKRTGTVFMIMVGLLLLFLALVAAWASYFMSDGTATVDQAAATDATPSIDDEMAADMQDPDAADAQPGATDTAEAEAGADALPVNMGGEAQAGDQAAADPAPTLPAEGAAAATDVASADPAPAATPEPAPGTAVATDVTAATAPVEDQDEIFLASMDVPPAALDALALPKPADAPDALPDPVMPPPAPGTVYQFDARGLLKPTPEGIMSPDGVFLIAGKPPRIPPSRSEVATAAAQAAAAVAAPAVPATPASTASDASLVTAGTDAAAQPALPPADPAMAGFRPKPRPEGLAPAAADDDAALKPTSGTEFAGLRPLPRPASVTAAAAAAAPTQTADLGAQAASLTAQAEAKLAEAAALEAQNPSVVAISMRPAARPNDFSSAVEAAVAAAVREPAPEAEVETAAAAPDPKPEEVAELDEPEPTKVAPAIPTKASVAKQATYANAINLSKINLIGTYGTDSRRYALVRQANGKYKKVKVGDRIDGGTVQAITDTEVRYQKGGRLVSLKMPKA